MHTARQTQDSAVLSCLARAVNGSKKSSRQQLLVEINEVYVIHLRPCG